MGPFDYRLELTATGYKTGRFTGDEVPHLSVASPPEFGGPGGVWSPEHLFVASVSTCLMTTFGAIAEMSGLEVLGYSDAATGRLVRDENRLFRMESVTLRPRIVVAGSEAADRAARLIEKAERACLISRSLSAEVVVEPEIVSEAVAAR